MFKRLLFSMAMIIVAGSISSCDSSDTKVSEPPPCSETVNACLTDNSPYFTARKSPPDADIIVIAKCEKLIKYKEETEGDWVHSWYFSDWTIDEVAKGNWPGANLAFVFVDVFPTQESGIMLKKLPFPYKENCVYRFFLRKSEITPLIIYHEKVKF